MPEATAQSIALAKDIYLQLTGRALTPAAAKLYSQHTRIAANQKGLAGWRSDEASERLDDAVQLMEAAFLKRGAGDSDWHYGMRRAGELLEWLTHREFNLEDIPVRMLAAAAYQTAGYTAMAASLFERGDFEQAESRILKTLLKADFPTLLEEIAVFWQRYKLVDLQDDISKLPEIGSIESSNVEDWIVNQIISALGVLCAQARWGGINRFEAALEKLARTSDLFLHSGNTYSWLLSRLVSDMANSLKLRLLRNHLTAFIDQITKEGKEAFELYARYNYVGKRAILWPSQILGLQRLRTNESFALCTPTGSGKTAVAEVAVLQSLFKKSPNEAPDSKQGIAPLAMYLVPSKALAAEAESRLSKIVQQVSLPKDPITVTGLYGGTDWGPTDAWLTREGKTVLICTYEKAEALIRFLGPLFLDRLRLIVVDEVHAVDFNNRYEELYHAESRALRLEALCARLFAYLAPRDVRIIGLSAVAAGIVNTLASWIQGKEGSKAVSAEYRSTRQLVGRLECLRNRGFEIRYDLLDGTSLQFSEGGESDTPFIMEPFPSYPPVPALEQEGPEKRLRPYLFWAAMHLTKSGTTGRNSTVLIFVPQMIGGYAKDFLTLLENYWEATLPAFFQPPSDPSKLQLWERCLNCCADYFTKDSREYKLLRKGVVVHHGKMPRLLSRLLVEMIEERIVNLVLATSTLSEGVNLPFEVLLIPTLRRGNADLSPREFANLAGRTGRPGVATEGRSLVLLPASANDVQSRRARERYHDIVSGLAMPIDTTGTGLSPLAELLSTIKTQWEQLPKSSGMSFERWLEEAQPLDTVEAKEHDNNHVFESLDVLDSILLSIIVEMELASGSSISSLDLEEHLKQIWRRTYAHYALSIEAQLSDIFLRRGCALPSIYSEADQRRRLYKTTMPPRHGERLMTLYSEVKKHLQAGSNYALWSKAEQFKFVKTLVEIVRVHPRFRSSDSVGKGNNTAVWADVLEWWLNPTECKKPPTPENVSDWYDFVYSNFDYRFNWGLSSILSIAFDDCIIKKTEPLTLDNWPASGLPWIAFWLKELVVWGTLEPVVAFLMARRNAWTRKEAETLAAKYYKQQGSIAPNDLLDPSRIRNWVHESLPREKRKSVRTEPSKYPAELLRNFSSKSQPEWRVIPTVIEGSLVWLDVAGFPLAKSERPADWNVSYLNTHDFVLLTNECLVVARPYL
jgi:hypothetical protein